MSFQLARQKPLAYVCIWSVSIILVHLLSTSGWTYIFPDIGLQEDSQDIKIGLYPTKKLIVKCAVGFSETWLELEDKEKIHWSDTYEEMRDLLESINKIRSVKMDCGRRFESHIFFDSGVKGSAPSDFVLQLIALLEDTLQTNPENCLKVLTPFGMTLSWNLPAPMENESMVFKIHLKDNLKVKNKKRWSQVMYMSYVLDFLCKDGNGYDGEAYILTTDADVKFTPDSVEALLDLMTRDPTVGAVCARTHPAGSGPLVWFQMFEYALGHWFQKVAEHMLGSVLCSPGCFSVYRCKALKDVLSTYSSDVDAAFDFLTKDMGEDRWLCTLLVQSGWRIEYCAAADNYTHCPDEFDEFYKQRRRWIASTIANLILLIKEWSIVSKLNHRVSSLFIIYQGILLISTLIGPSTVILIISGGLYYAWTFNVIATAVVQVAIVLVFGLICLKASQNTQLLTAKLLTVLYSIIMAATVLGTIVQIVKDVTNDSEGLGSVYNSTSFVGDISVELPVSVTTLYLAALVGMFLVAGLLHLPEIYCLFYGFCYLLCLPSAFLLLTVYSISNITDRSWGTREEKCSSSSVPSIPWQQQLRNTMAAVFFCFKYHSDALTVDDKDPKSQDAVRSVLTAVVDLTDAVQSEPDSTSPGQGSDDTSDADATIDSTWYEETPIAVEEWLPSEIKTQYATIFKSNGFENTLFITGMNGKDLQNMGIKKKGHIQCLLEEIKRLPDFEIETDVPENCHIWLEKIGMSEYEKSFVNNQIIHSRDMEVLTTMSAKEITKDLHIQKPGHVKRLLRAIRRLRYPLPDLVAVDGNNLATSPLTKQSATNSNGLAYVRAERRVIEMRPRIDVLTPVQLVEHDRDEYNFWEALKLEFLLPVSDAFGMGEELKEQLGSLRNLFLLVLTVTNIIWLVVVLTLASKARLNTQLYTNPLGLAFLCLFGVILFIQFLCMLSHRLFTLQHLLARAPYRFGQPLNPFWSTANEIVSTHSDVRNLPSMSSGSTTERTSRVSKKDDKISLIVNADIHQ